jgi:hypothetical protein
VNASGLVTAIAVGDLQVNASFQGTTSFLRFSVVRSAGFVVSGRVTDGTSGGVLPNISVSIADAGSATKTALTDSSGNYSIGGVAQGAATLTATATSYETNSKSITVSTDTKIDLVMVRTAGPAPTPTPVPGGQFIYVVDPGVSAADEAFVRDGLNIAAAAFQRLFGWTPPNTTVRVSAGANGSLTAAASSNSITAYTGSSVWRSTSGDLKRKIMSHELFHVVQFSIGWPFSTLTWLTEGSAEYVGYRVAIIERGIQSEDQTRGCHQFNVVHSSPSIPPLFQLEGQAFYGPGSMYSVGYLAAERLAQSRGVGSFTAYPGGFSGAFGTSLGDFYTAFEQYRATWSAPANYTCQY